MATKIARTGVEREYGYLYFLDKRGDVSRVPAQRGGGKQKRGKKEGPNASGQSPWTLRVRGNHRAYWSSRLER